MGQQITKVLPGLYIGANDNAKNDEQLIANSISHILSVQSSDTQIDKISNHTYLTVFLGKPDVKSLLHVIPETNDFIHSARSTNGSVLVHSESGISSNVAVVAAYLMTVYELDSKTAVSTLRGLVHAAQPVSALQTDLDKFWGGEEAAAAESTEGEVVNATTERKRLLAKFGEWKTLEVDKKTLLDALSSHDNLSASGAFLIGSGENRTPLADTSNNPPQSSITTTAHLPRAPNADVELSFDDLHGHGDTRPSPPTAVVEEEDIHESEEEQETADKEDDENDVVGSIPISRGFMGAYRPLHQRSVVSASYRPPITAAAAASRGGVDGGGGGGLDGVFEMAEDVGSPPPPPTFASTAPTTGGFYRPR